MLRDMNNRDVPAQCYVALDAYRGFAALLVFIGHVYPWVNRPLRGTVFDVAIDTLWMPVGWFFALSGFVVWLPYARAAIEGQPGPAPHRFLLRRLARLVPLYLLVVIAFWCW